MPCSDKQMIGQTVQIGQCVAVDGREFVERNRSPFGPAGYGAGEVKVRDGNRASWQDEAFERFQRRIHRVDFFLEPLDLPGDNAERMSFEVGAEGRRKIGAEVEHLILDRTQPVRQFTCGKCGNGEADRAIGLVDIADRSHSRRRFGNATAVDQPGRASVARARVDFIKFNQ